MNARSTRGPGGGRSGGRRPAVRKGGGRSSGGGGGGILTGCEFAIPLLPVLVLYALARHLYGAWQRRHLNSPASFAPPTAQGVKRPGSNLHPTR